MTQENVRRILQEMGGRGTTSEIAAQAKSKYPEKTLHTYVGQILRRLSTKGFVSENNGTWSLTELGEKRSIEGVPITDIDLLVTDDELAAVGLDVVNIVATIDISCELDLYTLSNALPKGEYHPESSPFMVYRPFEEASVALLVPTNGMISIVGAKSKEEIIDGSDQFFSALSGLGIKIESSGTDALVQNSVIRGELGVELELSTVAVALGFEKSEYEPEQFPGLICRLDDGTTNLIFRTGKYLVNGSKSYSQALGSNKRLIKELQSLGIEVGS